VAPEWTGGKLFVPFADSAYPVVYVLTSMSKCWRKYRRWSRSLLRPAQWRLCRHAPLAPATMNDVARKKTKNKNTTLMNSVKFECMLL